MNRSDLVKISRLRLKEAKTLLFKKRYSGAYYLSGYVIECALKACIAKKTKKSEFPNKEAVLESYTHSLTQLIKAAGLELKLTAHSSKNIEFGINWAIVKDWSEQSRYEIHNQKKAEDLYKAIADSKKGVLEWIMQYW